jgi:ribonuclease BN (tRNA processing enzyme)
MAADVLIHEARALEMLTKLPEDRRSFGAKNHTTSEQLAVLAAKARPRLLVVYHAWISSWPSVDPSGSQPVVLTTGEFHSSAEVLQKEIGSRYSGNFAIGQDLGVY